MCLVRAPDDPTDQAAGSHIPELGITIRYPSEFNEASRHRERLATADRWRGYFSSIGDEAARPARLFTSHGTVFYVDEASGEVRHGPLSGSPRNVLFHWHDGCGEIVYRPEAGTVEAAVIVDPATTGLRRADGAGKDQPPLTFERVPVAKGFGLDQTLMTNNLVGLRANGLFLCAQADGSVRLDRLHCRMWEHFRIVPVE
jgi:hypothetical protein